ncbi:hypothetical protein R6Q59_034648 [Mikania micrantha]
MSRATVIYLILAIALFCMSSSEARLVPAHEPETTVTSTQEEYNCEGVGKEECFSFLNKATRSGVMGRTGEAFTNPGKDGNTAPRKWGGGNRGVLTE